MDIGDVDSFILQPSHAHLKVLHSLEEMDGVCNVARSILMDCAVHEKNHMFTHVHWLHHALLILTTVRIIMKRNMTPGKK